jgi:hypothetical protein
MNDAAEIKLRAGELLAESDSNKGAAVRRGSAAEPRLSDLGITKKQSHRWQKEASVPAAA